MRKVVVPALFLTASLLGPIGPASAEPVSGASVGAAVPTSRFRDIADAGGSLALWGGYRFSLTEEISLSLLGEPQLVAWPTAICDGVASPCDDVTSLFSLTAGPEIVVGGERLEFFAAVKGGYYMDLSGPIDDRGQGYNTTLGLDYRLGPNTTLGVFARRDEAFIEPGRGGGNAEWVTVGLRMTHHYAEAPPVLRPAEVPPPVVPPPPPPPPKKRKIILRGVRFDYGSWVVRNDALAVLDQAADLLRALPDVRIAVEGHTDSTGSEKSNRVLSTKRAQSVADYLVRGGVAAERLVVRGIGEGQPVAPNNTREGRAQNRRVELQVLPAE